MIVHVFNERIYLSQNLSPKVSGMHPIYINGKIMANIVADNGNWAIKLSTDFSSKDLYFNQPRLEPYKIYTITSKLSNEQFRLILTPRYNPNVQSYDILFDQITIGSDVNCDIYFPLGFSDSEYLKIALVDSKWIAETNSPNFFLSNERLQNGQRILNGDYIFFTV